MEELQQVEKTMDDKIDELEATMLENFPMIDCPLVHRFTEGLYSRQIFMPSGSLITSKIHKTEHQYFILKGAVSVWIDEGVEEYLEAPYVGTTFPGTRRVLYIWEDCIWVTVHANPDNENEVEIEERIIEKHDNPLLSQQIKNKLKELHLSNNKK